MSEKDKSTAIGAGAGAVGGAILTGGSAVGTIGGAAVGGYIGHEVNNQNRYLVTRYFFIWGLFCFSLNYGFTDISFFTALTPLTFIVIFSAVFFCNTFFTKPDSITIPFKVSTVIAEPSTVLSSKNLLLMDVVMTLSSIYAPTDSWSLVTAQPEKIVINNDVVMH